MTKDTLIDLTNRQRGPKRHTLNRCHYCSHDRYPYGKVIMPLTDKNAIKTDRGDWKCGYCTVKDLIEMNNVSSSQ